MKKIFKPEDAIISHLNPIRVWYAPKNISTEAIFVTNENVGKLALEFEAELKVDDDGNGYFSILVQRGHNADQAAYLKVCVGTWLLPLRGELHAFPDIIFQKTFEFEDRPYEAGYSDSVVPVSSSGHFVEPRFPLHSIVNVVDVGKQGRVRDISSSNEDGGFSVIYSVAFPNGTNDWFREDELENLPDHPELPKL